MRLQIRNWGSVTLGQYKTEEEDEGVKYVPLLLMRHAPLSLEDQWINKSKYVIHLLNNSMSISLG